MRPWPTRWRSERRWRRCRRKIPTFPLLGKQTSDVRMEIIEIILRLGAATLAGCVIGLNRDLRGKPTGVRTLGVVALASALIVMAANDFEANEDSDWAATSRVIQG